MLEFFLQGHGLARARSSEVAEYLDGYATTLREIGYCKRVAKWCITYALHLGRWAAAEGVPVTALNDSSLNAFLAHLPRCHCAGHRPGRHALARPRTKVFVEYLGMAGIVLITPPQPVAIPELVSGFCHWMTRQRGATDATIRIYRRRAVALVARLGENPGLYDASAVRMAVRQVTGGHNAGVARQVVTVARALLRYLAVEGRCRPGLDAAVLPVPSRRLASLPRYVSAADVQRIIAACDPDRSCGVRDRAILLLLARLGLRGGDIVQMRLNDIDWTGGRLRVVGKGRREVSLPLPQDAGDAILTYLRDRRAVVGCDHVFLRAQAPWRPLGDSASVSAIVGRAIERAGVSAPTHGAHLLRHSAATAMLREGISLPSIGIVLRHRSLETTALYAKVDVKMLRAVAQPWIGGAP